MYLSELEIFGFKSFGQKTRFKFNGGITALVGPNGCGKTNIVDAIRWVLGEQKTSVLRSDVMENVIFNGTATRKPLGISEVTMVIENDKGILPSDYNQVNITRRLFRSGESNYFLNKAKCRLKDVHDLFMDTGMGADSYSVIELKMVEAILSGKPEERRHLFEEAAGIVKYKIRRKEATNKLIRVKEDLDRVNDILFEVQKNVNSLGKQAAKTRRYNNLLSELKETELKLYYYEILNLNSNIHTLQEELNKVTSQIYETEQEIDKIGKDKELEKEEANLLQVKYQECLNKEKEINNSYNYKKRELAVCSERLNSLVNQQKKVNEEVNNSAVEIEQIKTLIEKTTTEIQEKEILLSQHSEELDILLQKKDDVLENLNLVKESYNIENSELLNLKNQMNFQNSLLNSNKQKAKSLNHKVKDISSEFEIIESGLIKLHEDEIRLKEELSFLEQETYRLTEKIKIETEKKEYLDNQLRSVSQIIIDNKNQLSGKRASLDFLKSLADSDQTTNFLMKSKEFDVSNEKRTLIESINIPPKYQSALLSVLGEHIHNFLVSTTAEAEKGIDILKSSKNGVASFVIKENSASIETKGGDGLKEIMIDGTSYPLLSTFIEADEDFQSRILDLVWNVVVVESIEVAKQIIKSGFDFSTYSLVCLDGTLFKSGNFIKGGSANNNNNKLIGRNLKIKEIEKEIAIISAEITANDSKIKELKEELLQINLPLLQSELSSVKNKINKINQETSKIEINIYSLENNKEILTENTKKLETELEELDNEITQVESNISEISINLDEKNQQFSLIKEELATCENEFKIKDAEYRKLEILSTKTSSELKSAERLLVQLNEQFENFGNKLELKQSEIGSNIVLIHNTEIEVQGLSEEVEDVLRLLDIQKNEKDNIEVDLKLKRSEIESLDLLFEQNRKTNSKQKEDLHKIDLSLNELLSKKTIVEDKIIESYQIQGDELDFEIDEKYNITENREQVAEIKRKLSEIGNVNFLALEEYNEQNERLVFTQNQVKDLVEAEKSLKETIFEINQTAERNFNTTFEKVRENFKYLFGRLFNEEGYADIKLAEGNPLETDIEITAKPPGKKPHSIEMLSGGEKTLTAIALLFAIYMVKPSPFCILDEVDAPLDDANIGRFVNMIREFTNNTQFLIVTHNKRTMEAADTLYGITQQEVGLSTIVSVRLGNEGVEKE